MMSNLTVGELIDMLRDFDLDDQLVLWDSTLEAYVSMSTVDIDITPVVIPQDNDALLFRRAKLEAGKTYPAIVME